MKKNTKIAIIIISILLIGCLSSVKLKTPNTKSAGNLVFQLNNMLKSEYSDEFYNNTGIKAASYFNAVIIMYSTVNKQEYSLEVETLYRQVYNLIKTKGLKTENLRYVITASSGRYDKAIFLDGPTYSSFVKQDNYNGLIKDSIFLEDDFNWPMDKDIYTLLDMAEFSIEWDAKWGSDGRKGAYKHANEKAYK